jgi:hypothetical protein
VSERLPELVDAKRLQAELGVTRAVAEKLMRALPVVTFPDVRKVYVRRSDVDAYIAAHTFTNEQVPVS